MNFRMLRAKDGVELSDLNRVICRVTGVSRLCAGDDAVSNGHATARKPYTEQCWFVTDA